MARRTVESIPEPIDSVLDGHDVLGLRPARAPEASSLAAYHQLYKAGARATQLRAQPVVTIWVDGVNAYGVQVFQQIPSGQGG